MSDTVRFFRDSLKIDPDLITRLAVPGTGTLVLGAREVELAALLPSYQYVIVKEAVFADVVALPTPAIPATATATTATNASMAQGYPQAAS